MALRCLPAGFLVVVDISAEARLAKCRTNDKKDMQHVGAGKGKLERARYQIMGAILTEKKSAVG